MPVKKINRTMVTTTVAPLDTPDLDEDLPVVLDTSDCYTKDDLHRVISNKKVLSLSDYNAFNQKIKRGRKMDETYYKDKIRFGQLIFSALDKNIAAIEFDLDKYKFNYSRHEFNTIFIGYIYQFFDKYVIDFCIGRTWLSERMVTIKLNPTAGKSHGHRKSYR